MSQLAFSLVLLIAAGLMIGTFSRLVQVDPGFEETGLATFKITLPYNPYRTPEDQTALLDRLLPEMRTIPGVRHAAITKFLPMSDEEWTWSVYLEGAERDESEKLDYGRHVVSPDYFAAMDIGLVAGRGLEPADRAESSPVVVVNQAFVRRFFPGGTSPLEKRFTLLGEDERVIRIVGVVQDVHHYALGEPPQPAYYAAYPQMPDAGLMRQVNVVLRARGNPALVISEARRRLRAVEPLIPVSDVLTMQERVSHSMSRWRFATILLGLFATVGLVLAVVGIYSVISFSVSQRVRDIGVRIALGAGPGHIVRGELAGGARLALGGIAIGLVATVLLTPTLSSLLYDIEALDPAIYSALSLLLGGVALLATWVPARRASRTDPGRVLRSD